LKTVAIIAEFNPFHNGHRHLLTEARKITAADYTIIVMSGNFVQRGAPAMTHKYNRTRMALLNSADLVLELPTCYATASAEFFAHGAIALLDRLGVTDHLFFGSESGDIAALTAAAAALTHESPRYQTELKRQLKKGLSFPAARVNALDPLDHLQLTELLNTPNNILAIEYLKALTNHHSTITPFTILRQGSGYADSQLSHPHYNSASAIRRHLETGGSLSALTDCLPENVLPLLLPESPSALATDRDTIINENDLSLLLHYKLLSLADSDLTRFLDVTPALSDKIKKNRFSFTTYRDFINRLKSRDLTYSRISRCLLHILLDIPSNHCPHNPAAHSGSYTADHTNGPTDHYPADQSTRPAADRTPVYYARLLGFRASAAPLLTAIKHHATIPLISKPATALDALTTPGQTMFKQDLHAAHIYDLVYAAKYHQTPIPEYTRSPIRI
jgi:predicted nucleotidyltransferase